MTWFAVSWCVCVYFQIMDNKKTCQEPNNDSTDNKTISAHKKLHKTQVKFGIRYEFDNNFIFVNIGEIFMALDALQLMKKAVQCILFFAISSGTS